ncbi:MAG: universal stress protein [Alphaproteobacteria bacterium]|nr:universal stress protein [Alphaproteobacteria bacterium]
MSSPRAPRKFLVVVDKTPESAVALRFATRRAQHTNGRVTLMCAAQPPDFQQWRGVEEIMKDEAHADAEELIYAAAKTVNDLSGIMPELLIPYGTVTDCLSKLLKDDRDISILVLASGVGKEGPGPLVSMFGKAVQNIPVTIVPGNFTAEQIDALA